MENQENLTKLTRKEAMLEALELTLGIVTDACKIIGIARQTHYDWMANDEDYRKAVDSIMEISLDFVESKLFETIRGVELPEDKIFCYEGVPVVVPTTKRYPPSDANIRWYLDRKGRKRGYIAEAQKEDSDKPEGIQPPNVTFTRENMSNGPTSQP
jgi:hypothetical protein